MSVASLKREEPMVRRYTTDSRVAICMITFLFSATLGAAPFTPVALTGRDAPGAAGEQFRSFSPPVINNNGVVTLFGTTTQLLRPNSNYANGIWTGTPGNLSLLALEGQAAPGAD